ncbi:Target of rapamycin complex 1 subunit mip1 [Fulvia fulva]|nr:Target of rapamycin complex 1 subunit mip1 [Fulvia fulva]WPV22849.1 Target of rapamycin complex 1 subunit mip1 [Fulvia fulva]WPV37494.1 Target of rapamycin complex 1 subunit mip1 [Fulvia fulva]
MTRGAMNEVNGKHPQPVLDEAELFPRHHDKSSSFGASERLYRPATSISLKGQANGNYGEQSDSDDDDALHIHATNGHQPGKPALSRAKSDFGQGAPHPRQGRHGSEVSKEEELNMRHGWHTQLQNEEVTKNLSENFFMYYEDKRHETAGNLPPEFNPSKLVTEWRMKDRLKTVSALLAVCLNVGVDPPDVIKTNPCARLECWVDPVPPDSSNQNSNNTNAQIGKNLQSQYENLSLRTRYKVILDPTIEELKKYTTSLRRTAHNERILFHYNGHGVPKPTQSGEVWCFNRSYTQYIPISLMDLQEWLGAPGLWVWDCSAAGGVIQHFLEAAGKHSAAQTEVLKRDPNRAQSGQPLPRWEDSIHLAACRDNEVLPTNPDLPADLFTSCLTTPIMMAVRFFILQNPLSSTSTVTLAEARNIPGKVSERRTPLGELNWIFTAITDTIAWNCLDKPLFKKLFRQDLMVAALFRNFLLAQRVMRMFHCHPVSHPNIPDTHDHPLWKSWDLAVEMILSQLPKLIQQQKANEAAVEAAPSGQQPPPPIPELEYVHSDFFADQLSAFEVYLSSAPSNPGAAGYAKPPEQLPIVLQVLLSQVHRLRALVLLSKFLDLGPWAVNLALSIGIFPYVLKLLQSQALELKAPMVFIWARILAVDQTCQNDLLKDQGFAYFTNILVTTSGIPIGNVAEHRAMCTFVIAMFCKDFGQGRNACMTNNPELVDNCLQHLSDMENPLLRQFSLLCLSNLCRDFPPAREAYILQGAHERICDRSHDPVPEVRVACLNALASFIATQDIEQRDTVELEEIIVGIVCSMGMDGSIMVRKELTIFYSEYVKKYEKRFITTAWEQLLEEQDKKQGKAPNEDDFVPGSDVPGLNGGINGVKSHQRSVSANIPRSTDAAPVFIKPTMRTEYSKRTVYRAVWRQLMSLSADPHPEVARNAGVVVDYTLNALLESPLGPHAEALLDLIQLQRPVNGGPKLSVTPAAEIMSRRPSRDFGRPETPPSPASSTATKPDGYFALSRTASVAAAMKNLIGWGPKTPGDTPSTPSSPTHARRSSVYSTTGTPYRSRPLTPADAAQLPPDLLDNIPGPPHQMAAPVPPTPYYKGRDGKELPRLPLRSDFFDWSASYFREPQMRPSEADEPGSKDYNERLWRRNRNDKIIASTQPLKEAASSTRWDKPCGFFGIGAAPVKMVFHQFENHLVTSDDRDSIAVWDWHTSQQLNRFSNGNPKGSRVTEVRLINEDDVAMLMIGSSDGVIKIYRHYEDPEEIHHVSSFRALSDLFDSEKGLSSGLVFDWQQGQGRALVAGDDRVVRVWQVGQELCISDIQTRTRSCITSLTSDQVEGNVFVAGFGNGSVKVFDQRLPRSDQMLISWNEHKSWIVGAHLQRGGMRELITAESNGGIRLWDIRMRGSVDSYNPRSARSPRSLRTLSVHEHAPVFATGGRDHTIRVYSTKNISAGRSISSFEPYMSYLRGLNTPRNAPITATAFHPHRMMLACGAVNDGHVNLFKCDVPDYEKKGGVVDEWKSEWD